MKSPGSLAHGDGLHGRTASGETDRAGDPVSQGRTYTVSILILITLVQTIAYADRVNLSVAAPMLIQQFHYTHAEIGLLSSILIWVLTVAIIPSGPFVDWIGARVAYPVAVGVWSVATMLSGISVAFAPLAVFRGLVGLGEGPMIPAGGKVIVETFARENRGFAIGTFFAGNKLGLALGIPFASILLQTFGLRWVFLITGAIGFVWITAFLLVYRSSPSVSSPTVQSRIRWSTLLRYRTTWGLMLGQSGYLYIYYIFATWLPDYLVQQRHMSIVSGGFVGMVPFLLGVGATIFGGWVADASVRRGMRVTVSRKLFTIVGLSASAIFTVFGAFAHDVWPAVIFLTLAVVGFSFATGSIQPMSVDIAPPHVVASLVALQNFGGNVGGSFAPFITGYLVTATGGFQTALLVGAGVAVVLGCGSFGLLVGNLDRQLKFPDTNRPKRIPA